MQAEPEAFGSVSEAERIQKIRRFKLPSFNSKTSYLLSSLSERAPVKRFLNTMIETNTRPADLARKLGVSRQEVSRLMDLRHTTKIDTVARALYALGRRLDLSLSAS